MVLATVTFARFQKLCELLGAVEHAGANSKESNPPGFAGAEQSNAGNAQTLRCLFLGK
jgi:hypothetical protein